MVHHPVAGVGLLVSILTLPFGLLTALFVGAAPAAVIFVVGWFLLTPVLFVFAEEIGSLLPDRGTGDESADQSADPLEQLKSRYARGEIDETEFKRRVERLVGVEDLDADGAGDPDLDDFDADGLGADDFDTSGMNDRELPTERE
ncbi:SHOCT domain-containing protein [Halosimplex litoreum]|uniref:SHOCT domain-containing protein n=1 Tax=Halosimplex litoreum TaxID=1198301 RepID=A0A7U3WAV6_9EURY|nr:SHOCT domain-containing protein [Halosimplex litoreum]QPV64751.1 SHOCT domain-containing protein [Halosimplex litoreum]